MTCPDFTPISGPAAVHHLVHGLARRPRRGPHHGLTDGARGIVAKKGRNRGHEKCGKNLGKVGI